jgi:hypothetical protein
MLTYADVCRLTEDSEFDNGSDKMSLVSANSSRSLSLLALLVQKYKY